MTPVLELLTEEVDKLTLQINEAKIRIQHETADLAQLEEKLKSVQHAIKVLEFD
jgi:peptidoglycan hydrolase CwlO-like protein